MQRPSPFDFVFGRMAEERFPALRSALDGVEPTDRDAFIMTREAIQLVRELRPDDGIGEAIDQLVALVHHAYLFWAAGQVVMDVEADVLDGTATNGAAAPAAAWYARFPERRVWAQVVQGAAHEPLDGCFAHPLADDSLRVLGVFGLHPDRAGFSVVEVAGPRPAELARESGEPLFAPLMDGGAAAGLRSIAGEEELLELGWRARSTAPAA
ncbi:MAG TPA: hypothetical protein VFT04_01010 [Gemmatimonadales bacterium]|nr:hypothetical protein [Gemmatimonadales bacterium]